MDRKEIIKETQDRVNYLISSYKNLEEENPETCKVMSVPFLDDFLSWALNNYPTIEEDDLTNEDMSKLFYKNFDINNNDIKLSCILMSFMKDIFVTYHCPFDITKSKQWPNLYVYTPYLLQDANE